VYERRFRFRAADCEAITEELGLVDWYDLFSRKVDLCVNLFYDVIWSCIEKFVQKLSRVTKRLNELKKKRTKAAKKMKDSERQYMVDDDISECVCERLRGDFSALRSTY
jgi:hypothetical protein